MFTHFCVGHIYAYNCRILSDASLLKFNPGDFRSIQSWAQIWVTVLLQVDSCIVLTLACCTVIVWGRCQSWSASLLHFPKVNAMVDRIPSGQMLSPGAPSSFLLYMRSNIWTLGFDIYVSKHSNQRTYKILYVFDMTVSQVLLFGTAHKNASQPRLQGLPQFLVPDSRICDHIKDGEINTKKTQTSVYLCNFWGRKSMGQSSGQWNIHFQI